MVTEPGENLVFLLSLPRSGSTMLGLALGSHSALLCPPEPWMLLKLASMTEMKEARNWFDDELARIGFSQFLPDEIFVKAARAFAISAYNGHLGRAKKRVFLDKTPRYYFILDFLDALFPKAQKIWLQRNPLDVALSYKTSWKANIGELVGESMTTYSFDFAVGLFELERYFRQPSPYKMVIKYEELVTAPPVVLNGICDFLNVDAEKEMLDYRTNKNMLALYRGSAMGDKKALDAESIHSRSVGKWAQGLTTEEVGKITGLLGVDIFRRMGYGDTIEDLCERGLDQGSEEQAAGKRRVIAASSPENVVDSRADKMVRIRQIRRLSAQIKESEGDRRAQARLITELTNKLQTVEADRIARLSVIEESAAHIDDLTKKLQTMKMERASKLEIIDGLEEKVQAMETDLVERQNAMNALLASARDLEDQIAQHVNSRWHMLGRRLRVVK